MHSFYSFIDDLPVQHQDHPLPQLITGDSWNDERWAHAMQWAPWTPVTWKKYSSSLIFWLIRFDSAMSRSYHHETAIYFEADQILRGQATMFHTVFSWAFLKPRAMRNVHVETFVIFLPTSQLCHDRCNRYQWRRSWSSGWGKGPRGIGRGRATFGCRSSKTAGWSWD